jgi:hypothetical protein
MHAIKHQSGSNSRSYDLLKVGEWREVEHKCRKLQFIFIPAGSTSLANFKASELAKSMLAGVTARMRQLDLVI